MRNYAAASSIALLLLAGACGRDWEQYNPGGNSGQTSSSSTGGTGGMGGAGGAGGMAGAGGTGGMAGAGGVGGAGGMAGAGGGTMLACTPGTTNFCYLGAPGTLGVGACKLGTQTCTPEGFWSTCEGQVVPSAESCASPADDDCDGAENENCAIVSKGFPAGAEQQPYAMAPDGAGNVVVVGKMEAGPDLGGGAPLPHVGSHDIFVAKFDSNGDHVWSKSFGGTSYEEPAGVAVDGMGNVIVTGYYSGTITFGATPPLTSLGGQDAFVVKLDPMGNPIWSKSFGGAGEQRGRGVAAHSGGDIVVVGQFQGWIDVTVPPSNAADDWDGFIARIGPDGTVLWAKVFGGTGYDTARGVAIDAVGNAFVTGSFDEVADFGTGPLPEIYDDEVFIVKLEPTAGAPIYARSYPSDHQQEGWAIAIDGAGNAAVTGIYRGGDANFGGDPLVATLYDSAFVLKVDSVGDHVWSRGFGYPAASGKHEPNAIAMDAAGYIVLTGAAAGTIQFGGLPLPGPGGTAQDVYVAKFSPDNSQAWSRRFGDAEDQDGRAVVFTSTGDLFVTGEYAGTIDFGKGPLGPASDNDLFLIKLDP